MGYIVYQTLTQYIPLTLLRLGLFHVTIYIIFYDLTCLIWYIFTTWLVQYSIWGASAIMSVTTWLRKPSDGSPSEVTNFWKLFFKLFFFRFFSEFHARENVKLKQKSQIASKFVGNTVSYVLLVFLLKCKFWPIFGKSQISKVFGNFRIKILPNVDSYGLILRKTFPSMIF